MSLIKAQGAGDASTGFYDFTIDQSLRFEDGDNPYLSKTFSSSGGTIFTFSCWVKFSNSTNSKVLLQGYSNSSNYTQIPIYSSGTTGQVGVYSAVGGSAKLFAYTTGHFVDPTAWYHVVVKFNGTSGSEEFKVYINGENQDITTSTALTAHQSFIGNNNAHYIGNNFNQSSDMDGYMAEVNFIDGTALDADSFGETKSGIWIPKNTSGLTFGTNGFRLKFQDSSALGDDTSGNGNDFSSSGLAATDVVLDSPTNNWATMNPLDGDGGTTWKEGNLELSTTNYGNNASTFFMETGKWYWEAMGEGYVGAVCAFDRSTYNNTISVSGSDSIGYFTNGIVYWGTGNDSTPATYTSSDIIGVAVNMDDGQISFYKNNTLQVTLNFSSTISRLATEGCYANYNNGASSANRSVNLNFGQDSSFAGNKTAQGNTDDNGNGDFYYSPPSGFLALCTANLPDPAIDPAQGEEPADHFNTVLYTGNNSTNNITGVGFQPDFVWLKNRSSGSTAHRLYDSVRGPHKALFSTVSNAEFDESSWGLDSFDSDGFTLLHDNTNKLYFNQTGQNYVAWNWLAGGSASSNSDGSITSSVSANTKAGFSIVGYTGTASADTVGHGLSQAPELVIWKDRETAVNWLVQGDVMGAAASGYIMLLNSTGSSYANSNFNTTLGASTITLDAGGTNYNGSGKDTIAYCFHSVDGFSKIGKYSATNSSNGPFVHLGFRPAVVIIKATNRASHWIMQDNKRPGYNTTSIALFSNLGNAESTDRHVDFLSNGFKLRLTALDPNTNTAEYIYLAFAEQPFKYSNAR